MRRLRRPSGSPTGSTNREATASPIGFSPSKCCVAPSDSPSGFGAGPWDGWTRADGQNPLHTALSRSNADLERKLSDLRSRLMEAERDAEHERTPRPRERVGGDTDTEERGQATCEAELGAQRA